MMILKSSHCLVGRLSITDCVHGPEHGVVAAAAASRHNGKQYDNIESLILVSLAFLQYYLILTHGQAHGQL